MTRQSRFIAPMGYGMLPFALSILLLTASSNSNASIDCYRSRPGFLDKQDYRLLFPKMAKEPEEETFTEVKDREKRFTLAYEKGLEKKEPAIAVMLEAREAIGRVEVRLGKFKEHFYVVVVPKLNGMSHPLVAPGTYEGKPAVLLTYNGSVTDVIAHGMAVRRLEELKPKCDVWLKAGAARLCVSGSGFDGYLFGILEKAGGPMSYEDAKKAAEDKDADDDDKIRALGTGWMLSYYQVELASERMKVSDFLSMKAEDRPDPKVAWKAVQAAVPKMKEKKGK